MGMVLEIDRKSPLAGRVVTLKKIALEAGLSISAVSHFLNGRSARLSAESRTKLQRIIDKYEYIPNRLVRGIQTKRTGCIGLVLPSCSSGYFPPLLDWIERAARDSGFHLLLAQSHYQYEMVEEAVQLFRGLRVDGMIIVPTPENRLFFERLVDIGSKIVFLEGYFSPPIAQTVHPDNRMCVAVAMEHLWQQGHRRIGHLSPLPTEYPSGFSQRWNAFQEWLSEHGVREPTAFAESCAPNDAGETALRLVQDKKCTALLGASDYLVLGALPSLREHGIRVPHDVALVGMANTPESAMSVPPLTSVAHQKELTAREVVRLLVRQINEPSAGKFLKQPVEIPPKLVIRESSLHQHSEAE